MHTTQASNEADGRCFAFELRDMVCKTPECERIVENKDTGLCASCAHAERKQSRVKLKEKKPMNKVSVKRALQTQQYLMIRKEYLEAYPACEVVDCHNKSKEVHHMAGRENDMLLNTNYFLAVCPSCHQRITIDSKWALDNGYSILRTTV